MEDERVPSVTVPALFDSDTIIAGQPFMEVGEGRYAMQKLLGEGGMAKVHLCRDELIGRDVAVKSITSDLQEKPGARARFLREASIQGQLEHPSIVPVHDIGSNPDGSPFLVMKRVRGRTLEEIIAGQNGAEVELLERFSRRRLLNAFVNVCLAVDFAHSRGVIHRDLKPSNIMLGDFGEVYLLDWGVAKLTSEAPDSSRNAPTRETPVRDGPIRDTPGEHLETKQGSVVGTPHYMAPEQIRGEGEATVASDVFALGAILFELLTGMTLRDPNATFVQIATRPYDARCSVRAPHEHVAPELEEICVRATAKDPSARFASARALSAALEEVLEGDRDAARRRELATQHVENARRARTAANTDAETAERSLRAELRELGSALILDPDNDDARSLALSALTTPPQKLPREVRQEFEDRADNQRRDAAGRWHWLALMWLAFGPLLYWAGVRDVSAALLAFGLIAISAVLARISYRRKTPKYGLVEYSVVMTAALAMVVVGRFFGPFILVPGLLGTFGVALQLDPLPSARQFALVVCAIGMIGAVAIHHSSIPATMRELPTIVVIVLIHVSAMVTSAISIAQVRAELTRAEQRLYVYAWQVRAMLPAPSGKA